jgi:hypothetical protein
MGKAKRACARSILAYGAGVQGRGPTKLAFWTMC